MSARTQGSPGLPRTVKDFARLEGNFQAWLKGRGSAVLAKTNPYEVLRFTTDAGTGIIYRDRNDRITNWVGNADVAFHCFLDGSGWRACERGDRETGAIRRRNTYRSLVERDGDGCMYCGKPVSVDEFSKEHVLSVTHGGTNHLANLAVTHAVCNEAASHLSVREKLEMAIRLRSAQP